MLRLGTHPRIVALHYCVVSAGEFLMFLTLVDGALSLDEAVATGDVYAGTLAAAQRRVERVLVDVATALGFCHARGVIHQDVKQQNVLFSRTDGRARLMDFGLSSWGPGADDALRAPLRGLTRDFASPEVRELEAAEANAAAAAKAQAEARKKAREAQLLQQMGRAKPATARV